MIVAAITIYIHKAMAVYVITYDTVMAFSYVLHYVVCSMYSVFLAEAR